MLKGYGVRIVIGASFFIFGFLVAANVLDMSGHDIAVGLAAGAVGGVTMLVVTLDAAFGLKPEIRRRLGWG
jgi:hypothetical protein